MKSLILVIMLILSSASFAYSESYYTPIQCENNGHILEIDLYRNLEQSQTTVSEFSAHSWYLGRYNAYYTSKVVYARPMGYTRYTVEVDAEVPFNFEIRASFDFSYITLLLANKVYNCSLVRTWICCFG